MVDADAAHIAAVAALVVISFVAYVAGIVFRKWPEKVCRYAEQVDGLAAVLPPETHLAMVRTCGFAFIVLSAAALLSATFLV